jgi:DNA-binding GntR family transcriptional regulator
MGGEVSETEDRLSTQAGARPGRRTSNRLSEVAYEQIRAELLRHGQLAFDGRFVEQQIAAQLSLSRTPVREAMQRLHLEGWLEDVPGSGVVVRRSRIRDVLDTFELRLLLEPLAATMAARDPSVTMVDASSDSGISFHLLVARAGGISTLENAIVEVSQFCVISASGGGTVDFGDDHARIVAAINSGDAEAAMASMTDHLLRVRQDRVRSISPTRGGRA